MKNTALNTAGGIFLVMAAAQAARFVMKVHVIAGTHEIPVRISAVAVVVLLALAAWMFKASAK